ncbi:MAG: hypothetical protein WB424_07540 [Terracidiphilus sp.]
MEFLVQGQYLSKKANSLTKKTEKLFQLLHQGGFVDAKPSFQLDSAKPVLAKDGLCCVA